MRRLCLRIVASAVLAGSVGCGSVGQGTSLLPDRYPLGDEARAARERVDAAMVLDAGANPRREAVSQGSLHEIAGQVADERLRIVRVGEKEVREEIHGSLNSIAPLGPRDATGA